MTAYAGEKIWNFVWENGNVIERKLIEKPEEAYYSREGKPLASMLH